MKFIKIIFFTAAFIISQAYPTDNNLLDTFAKSLLLISTVNHSSYSLNKCYKEIKVINNKKEGWVPFATGLNIAQIHNQKIEQDIFKLKGYIFVHSIIICGSCFFTYYL